jgi:hypothetical protein
MFTSKGVYFRSINLHLYLPVALCGLRGSSIGKEVKIDLFFILSPSETLDILALQKAILPGKVVAAFISQESPIFDKAATVIRHCLI